MARWRYSIIAGLLINPPRQGELANEIGRLADTLWRDPVNADVLVKRGFSTIEDWYYRAKDAADPIAALMRKPRSDKGSEPAMSGRLLLALKVQYLAHPRWSYALHADNLVVVAESDPGTYGAPVSESTVRRRMKKRGWTPKKKRRHPTPGQRAAEERLEKLEVRSFEASQVHALWHWDCHEGKGCRIADGKGNWHVPIAFAILDDCSRLCCHMQWYLAENAANVVHGLTQAICKRGLPRSAMHDNGPAMTAHETQNGLRDNGVIPKPTLPHSPYQNGKQESFWGQVEGRLLAMLESVEPLTLDFLNRATLAWVEMEYNRSVHSEIGISPLDRALQGPSTARPAPSSEQLARTFTAEVFRTQRLSDGTISLDGVRFEVPNLLRTLRRVCVRYRSWDLSVAWIVDPATKACLARIRPVDKARNADGRRRSLVPLDDLPDPPNGDGDPVPALMRKLLEDYAATGLPPAYLPKDERVLDRDEEDDDE
jgi:transposase InsO family protein